MRRRRAPRHAAEAIGSIRRARAPETLLAAVQQAWPDVVGDAVAAQAEPVAEREGTVTVSCRTATWAQELDLMQAAILDRLNTALAAAGAGPVAALRLTGDAARFNT